MNVFFNKAIYLILLDHSLERLHSVRARVSVDSPNDTDVAVI